MAKALGFPRLTGRAPNPGEVFAASYKGQLIFALQGEHKPVFLFGHGREPAEMGGEDGRRVIFPNATIRPLRDRPVNLSWSASAQPGDLVITDKGPMLRVWAVRSHADASPAHVDIDIETGKTVATGHVPVIRGWELVCFPLPGRPMVLATYDPAGPPSAQSRA
jgi:hypothetical protein